MINCNKSKGRLCLFWNFVCSCDMKWRIGYILTALVLKFFNTPLQPNRPEIKSLFIIFPFMHQSLKVKLLCITIFQWFVTVSDGLLDLKPNSTFVHGFISTMKIRERSFFIFLHSSTTFPFEENGGGGGLLFHGSGNCQYRGHGGPLIHPVSTLQWPKFLLPTGGHAFVACLRFLYDSLRKGRCGMWRFLGQCKVDRTTCY